MTRTIIDVHVLQTVPPSNLNRDDTGSPKSAVYGGVRRARVSSQAWKKATRSAFGELLDTADLGVRTKRVVELVSEEIVNQDATLQESAGELAKKVLLAAGLKIVPARKSEDADTTGYLMFFSRRQVANLATAAIVAEREGSEPDKGKIKSLADRDHSIDLALFGRMVADQADLNVDAAAMVAHAISVHAVDTEFDYFTAVDDQNPEDESGAGMIGTIEFNSSTLYRYATLDVDRLQDNLGDGAVTGRAVQAFVEAFVRSMPTGKQNTFANRTLPEAVVVMLRDRQPINLVGAFEAAVIADGRAGRIRSASEGLAAEAQEIAAAYNETPVRTWVTRVGSDTEALDDLGERVPLSEIIASLGDLVSARLSGTE